MGEHKRNPTAIAAATQQRAVITDIEDVGKILELEKVYCDRCGAEFPLWPPELLNDHLHEKHEAMYWPQVAKEWNDYKADSDLARRQNYLTQYRVKFLFLVLQNRCDLYQKLVAAGVIVARPRGESDAARRRSARSYRQFYF